MRKRTMRDQEKNFYSEGSKQKTFGNPLQSLGYPFRWQLPAISFLKGVSEFKKTAIPHNLAAWVLWLNRLSLFLIFFWFGFLKIFSLSPAEALVTHLHKITLSPFVSIHFFLVSLGIVECIIGIMWLIPSITKYTFVLFMLQMFAACLPLILLPRDTWSDIFVLSLSGQYILKNVVLIACAFTIYKDCQPKGWKKCN